MGDLVKWLKRYEQITNEFSNPELDPDKMEKLLAEQGDLQEKLSTPTAGKSIARSISRWTRFDARLGKAR